MKCSRSETLARVCAKVCVDVCKNRRGGLLGSKNFVNVFDARRVAGGGIIEKI